ncbi:MAG: hypothetical protein JSS83_16555 [Cyanobacteria bacterium SZAS LIN-3]|nr:hypothetical protein [Cyanobacteria bacterium SZAS LIN-3]
MSSLASMIKHACVLVPALLSLSCAPRAFCADDPITGFRSECGPGLALKKKQELLPWLAPIRDKIRRQPSFGELAQSLENQKENDVEVWCFFAINPKSGQLENERIVCKNADGSSAGLLLELLKKVAPYDGYPNDTVISDGLAVRLIKHGKVVRILVELGTLSSTRRLSGP